jgi:hypothetical protein
MKISYNVTGQERKSLVGAVSTALNSPVSYLGAPTFAYEVGGYHVGKQGTLTGADDNALVAALAGQGFVGETELIDAAEPDEAALTLEFPLDGFTPETLDNLSKMVTAKEALIKAALGADDIPIQVGEATVKFPWFTLGGTGDAAYYVQFIQALCMAAKEKKRVTAREQGLTANPKYAMRCWLLSLGLIGDEYKNARKLLLSRLDGNSSFKGGSRPTYTAHLYTYPYGSEEDAMDCETSEFTSLAKAKACCDGFASDCESVRFAGCHVEGDDGSYLYEILTDGTVSEK